MSLERLTELGFDQSYRTEDGLRVSCSRCSAVVINGIPTHESGCSNAVHECRGCNAVVYRRYQYCEDCN